MSGLLERWRNRRAAKSDLRAIVTVGPDDLLVVQVSPRLGEEVATAMKEAFETGAPHLAGRVVIVVADSVAVVRGGGRPVGAQLRPGDPMLSQQPDAPRLIDQVAMDGEWLIGLRPGDARRFAMWVASRVQELPDEAQLRALLRTYEDERLQG